MHKVVADVSGVYYIGNFSGSTLDIRKSDGGSGTAEDNDRAGFSDIIVLDYHHNGNVDWSRTIASRNDDIGHGITQDADSLYITGAIENNTDFPGFAGNPLSTSSQQDIFLASLAKSNGSTGWVRVFPSTNAGNELGRRVDMNASGNLYMTGDYSGDLQFPDGVTLSALGGEDVFVSAFSANGSFDWAKSAGSSGNDAGFGLAAGSGGSIYICGRHDDEMTLGPLNLPDNPGSNGYLSRLAYPEDTILPLPLADPGPYGDVCGSTLGLQAIPSSGVGVWSQLSGPGSATFTPSENDPTVSVDVDQFGIYTFAWTETNISGSDDSIFTVEFFEPALANAGTGGDTCSLSFELNAVPSVGQGQWSLLGGPGTVNFLPSDTVPDALVSVSRPGTYTLQWTETNGICMDQTSIDVSFNDKLIIEVGEDVIVCGMEHIMNALPQDISGSWTTVYGPGNGSFSPSETDPVARVTVDAYGEYLFRWDATEGSCSGEDSVMITFHREPEANAGPDQVLENKFSTYLEAIALSADVAAVNPTASWSLVSGSGQIINPGDPATQVTELQVGENVFRWTISSDYCPDVWDQVIIIVSDVETNTVITPNNDGLNDMLVFPGVEEQGGCEIIIYNRWGMEVYRNKDYQNNWDGRDQNDRLLDDDTYYYILRIPPDRIIKSFVEIRGSQ